MPLAVMGVYGSEKVFMGGLVILGALMIFEWMKMSTHRRHLGLGRTILKAVGILYIGLGTWCIYKLRHYFGPSFLMWILCLVWATDIGAYMVGKVLGGPGLAPWISPGKTWSGALGGVIIGTSVAYASLRLTTGWPSQGEALKTILLLVVAAQGGDLIESWSKRLWKVKDSGHLIPGHGGVLDRLDSVLFVSTLVVVWRGVGWG
jgi:phosphatidate cytidylyltransferase